MKATSMASVHLYASNDLERLAAQMVRLLGEHRPADAFAPQTIVVQDLGVQRWLTWYLARAQGICANIKFCSPKEFVNGCLYGSDSVTKTDPYSVEAMTWRLLAMLQAGTVQEESVARYVQDDPDATKAHGLARRLAGLFDQYMVYRPDWIAAWRTGGDLDWQGDLWCQLREELGEDPASLRRAFLRKATAPATDHEPVFFFGLGMLPPEYLRVIHAAARQRAIHVLLTQPTAQLWTDLISVREEWNAAQKSGNATEPFTKGHRLLVSWGRIGREFQDVLLETLEADEPASLHVAPTGETLLAQLQSDIFNVDRPDTRRPAAENDGSIQIHSCHSPLREVEVLHDQLLRLFATRKDLHPHDVVVMTPDIEGYAPFLRAVFDNPECESQRIPYTLADRSPRRTSGLIDAFLSLLELGESPLPVTEVLAWLETAAVRRRFGLEPADVERLHNLCREGRIHWGYDAAHRVALGLPATSQNTWRDGLDKMLLGYAMHADNRALCEGILPLPGVEGSVVAAVGALEELVTSLREHSCELAGERTLAEWAAWMESVRERFFKTIPDEERDAQQIRTAINNLRNLGAHFSGRIPLAPVRSELAAGLEKGVTRDGFLRGKVTCCALKPLRSVPFRVICLLGLNDAAFPRANRQDGLDLMAGQRLRGDRSVRDDDRYLFLETLLAAREVIYLSYLGQSQKDELERPPSVMVNELLDALDADFTFAAGTARAQLLRRHRLQAFSPAYFDGSNAELFSHSKANAAAATMLGKVHPPPPPFCAAPLDGAVEKIIQLDELLRFFRHPVRYFMQRRLGLYLGKDEKILRDTEPFVLGTLDRYGLQDRLLNLHAGLPSEANMTSVVLRAQVRAEGSLPHDHAGDSLYMDLEREAERLVSQLDKKGLKPQPGRNVPVDLRVGEFQVRGELRSFAGAQQLSMRCAKIDGRDWMAAWLRHLVWHSAVTTLGDTNTTAIVGCDKGRIKLETLRRPDKPAALLEPLLQLYYDSQSMPPLLFIKSSSKYAEVIAKGEETAEALARARKVWEGDEYQSSEGEDEDHTLCHRDADPLAKPDFAALAETVFKPLLDHLEK